MNTEKKGSSLKVRERHFFKPVLIQVTAAHIITLNLPQIDFHFYKMSDEVAKLQKQKIYHPMYLIPRRRRDVDKTFFLSKFSKLYAKRLIIISWLDW